MKVLHAQGPECSRHRPDTLKGRLRSSTNVHAAYAIWRDVECDACSALFPLLGIFVPSLFSLARPSSVTDVAAAAQTIVDAFAASDDQLRLLARTLADGLSPSNATLLLEATIRDASDRQAPFLPRFLSNLTHALALSTLIRSTAERH